MEQEQQYNASNQRHVSFDENDTVFQPIGGNANGTTNVHSYGKITQQNPFESTQGRTSNRNFNSRNPNPTYKNLNNQPFEVSVNA